MATETIRTHVVLPKDMVEEIDRRQGERHRSEYIAEVLEKALRRERLKEAYARVVGSIAEDDVPGWETAESITEWVSEQRRSWRDPWAEAAENGDQ